jgi:hypothetical protein
VLKGVGDVKALPLVIAGAALLAGCAQSPATLNQPMPAAPPAPSAALPEFMLAEKINALREFMEQQGRPYPYADDAPKAAPALPRRAGRRQLSPDTPDDVAVEPRPALVPATPDDPRSCVGWWRICHFL